MAAKALTCIGLGLRIPVFSKRFPMIFSSSWPKGGKTGAKQSRRDKSNRGRHERYDAMRVRASDRTSPFEGFQDLSALAQSSCPLSLVRKDLDLVPAGSTSKTGLEATTSQI